MDRLTGEEGQELLDDLYSLDVAQVRAPEAKRQLECLIARMIDLTREDTEVDAWRRNWVANAIGATHLGWYSAALMALEVPLLHRDYDGPSRIHPNDLDTCLEWLRDQPCEAACRAK